MRTLTILLALTAYDGPTKTWELTNKKFQVDRIIDREQRVVCYVATHNDGSSHTTPAIACLPTTW